MVKIALGQFNARLDRDFNVTEAVKLIAQARDADVQVICFHELATSIYFCFGRDDEFKQLAEPEDGPSVRRIQAAARDHGVAVIYPFYERASDGRLFNSAVVIDRNGGLIGKYRKMSIPQVLHKTEPGEAAGDERYYFEEGDLGFPVFDVAGLKVGILICYDRHYPEAVRSIALRGAEVLFVPTATYRSYFRRAWEVELTAHAIANCFYVAGVNRVGVEEGAPPDRFYFGSSLVVDPTGSVVARASEKQAELLTAEILPDKVRKTRDLWGFFRFRRPDAYGALTEPLPRQSDLTTPVP